MGDVCYMVSAAAIEKFQNNTNTDAESNTDNTDIQASIVSSVQSHDVNSNSNQVKEEQTVQCSNLSELNCLDNVNCVIGILPNSAPQSPINSNSCTASIECSLTENGNNEHNDTGIEDKPYRCHICGKLFSRNSSLKCHIRLHIEGPENILRSNSNSGTNSTECIVELPKRDEVDREKKDEVGEEILYSCIFCDKQFSRKSGLKCHIQFHIEHFRIEGTNDAFCDPEGKQTPSRKSSSDLDCSSQTSPDKEYACVICDLQFSRKSSLIMHYRNHPMTKATEDEELRTDQFYHKLTVDIVKQKEIDKSDERKCSVVISGKNVVTQSKGDQLLDDNVEGEDKQYKCYICDKLFARNSSLAWHIQFHETHMYSKPKKSSDTCLENGVKNANDLHIEGNDYRCHVCGKMYYSNSNLRRHMTCHGELPIMCNDVSVNASPVLGEVICDLCNRTFKNLTSLKKHFVQMHKGKQMCLPSDCSTNSIDNSTDKFKCDLCDRSYFLINSLRRHVMTAHPSTKEELRMGETDQYKCSYCPKLFISDRAKKIHMTRGHGALLTDKAPADNVADESLFIENADGLYECYLCDRTFDRRSTLSRHVESHNVETGDSDIDLSLDGEVENESVDKFNCPHCDRVFENKKGLSRHIGYHNSQAILIEKKRQARCKDCNKHFETVRAMRIHVAHAHKNQTSNDVNSQSESEMEVSESSQFECPHCDRVFDSRRARSSHMVQAHKPLENLSQGHDSETEEEAEESGDLKCCKCSRVFQNKRARSSHVAQAHRSSNYDDSTPELDEDGNDEEPEQYECPSCDRTFDSKRARSSHISQAHKPVAESETDLFRCVFCKRLFDSARAMNIHAATKHKEENIDNELDNTKPKDSNLVRQSDNKQMYLCPECPKMFGHPKSVSRHVREHKLEREKSEREMFLKLKSSEKSKDTGSIKCGLCAKTFINVKGLAGHMKIHSKTVPDSASVESNDTLISSTLYETVSFEEGVKKLENHVCDETFLTEISSEGHTSTHIGSVLTTESDVEPVKLMEKEPSMIVEEFLEVVKDEDLYTCEICNDSFSCKQLLKKHIKNHMAGEIMRSVEDSVNEFQCQACGRQYNGEKSLKSHMYRCHRELMNLKQSAKYPSAVSVSRMNHIKKNEQYDSIYKCDLCGQMYSNYRAYRSHRVYSCCTSRKRPNSFNLSERGIPNEFKCEYCDQSFLLQCHLQKHLKSRCNAIDLRSDLTTERDGVEVSTQSKRLRRSTFISPLYEYDPIGSYKCDECEKSFISKQNWQRHLSMHKAASQKTENSSTTTKLTFSFRENSESVPQKQPNLEAQFREMPYECVYCEKCFKEKDLLLEHIRTHAETNELEGDGLDENSINFHAGEHFVIENSEGDEEHFIFEQHDDSEGYQCNECEDNYKDKLQMIIHMSYHLNSKLPPNKQKSLVIKADSKLLAPYACRFCSQRFINKSYRVNHLRAHHLNDVFQCDVCQKMFLCKSNLQLHCRQHMIDTRHQCDYCYKYFSSRWFLLRHTKVVHGKKIRCKNCDFECESKTEMDEHSCTLHTMETKTCELCSETFLEEEEWNTHMQTHNT